MIIIYFIKVVARYHIFVSNTIRIIRLYADFILYYDGNQLKPKNHKSKILMNNAIMPDLDVFFLIKIGI